MDKKIWITILLGICCITAGILHFQIDPKPPEKLQSPQQLDSIILQKVAEYNISDDQIHKRTVKIDSSFQRNIFTIQVSPQFSKTTFHYRLHNELYDFGVTTYGTVIFPEHNLDLHLVYNQTIHRTLRLRTDPELGMKHLGNQDD